MRTMNMLALAAAVATGLVACKQDDDTEPDPPATGTLVLSWGFHWMDDTDLDLDATYSDDFGHAIKLHEMRYFINDLLFKHGSSTAIDLHNTTFLFSAETENAVSLGDYSPTSFDSLQFTIGLDSGVNHGDPATAPAPLNDTTMHWGPGTANGYYFLVLEGQVDDDGNGVVDAGDPTFTYKCATDALSHRVTRAASYSISAGAITPVHIHVHVGEILAGIDVLNNLTAIGAQPVNAQLMDQLVDALEVE